MADKEARDEDTEAVKEYDRLKSDRSRFETRWESARKQFLPDAEPFNAMMTPGEMDRRNTIDSYGIYAAQRLADFLWGELCDPQKQWINLMERKRVGESPGDIARWLQSVRNEIHDQLNDDDSNFDVAMHGVLHDWSVFNNSILFQGDRPGRAPLFRHLSLSNSVWRRSKEEVNDFFGVKELWSLRDILATFPGVELPAKLEDAHKEGKLGNEYDLLHVVDKNPAHAPGHDATERRAWRSRWLLCDGACLLSENFDDTSCYTAFHGPRRPGEHYGRGTGWTAVEEGRLMQRIAASTVGAVEKGVYPTTVVPDDGVMSRPTQDAFDWLVLHSDQWVNGKPMIAQLPPGGQPQVGLEYGKYLQLALDRHFYRDKMSLPREPRMPTQHILALDEERHKELTPLLIVFRRPLAGVVKRSYSIGKRDRWFPSPPLGITQLQVRYQSPLERARLMGSAKAFAQMGEVAKGVAEVHPQAMHRVKWDKGLARFAEATGVDLDLIATDEEYEAAVQGEAEAMAAKSQMEQLKDMTTAGKNAAPLLKVMQGGGGGDAPPAAPPDIMQLLQGAAA